MLTTKCIRINIKTGHYPRNETITVHERCRVVATGTICFSNSQSTLLDSCHTNLLLLQAHDYSNNTGITKARGF